MDARGVVARRLRAQAAACAGLGSPLYAGLLERVAGEVEAGGPSWEVLGESAAWPRDTVYGLRFMGAVNRLVLSGAAPELAAHFAPGGDPAAAWPPLRRLIAARSPELRVMTRERPVQTNEVGRCAALAPAILWLSGGRRIRLLEIGASAGLNLRFDRYRYGSAWGDPGSAVRIPCRYDGDPPPFAPARLEVVERRGCDAAPIDPATPEGALTLRSFVWPDQPERLEMLDEALQIANRLAVPIDAAGASDWLERLLGTELQPDCVTIVFHSIVWQYLEPAERRSIIRVLEGAGRRATAGAALAWLRMEPDGDSAAVQATSWPGGESRLLARSGFHGKPVSWLLPGR